MNFKFTSWKWTFHKTSLSIAKLTHFVIAPNEEGPIIENSHAVSPTADKLLDQQRRVLLIDLVEEFGDVLHQREVLQV